MRMLQKSCQHIYGRQKQVKNHSFSPFRRDSFTIVELLIVISIIAILASLLLPALGKARDKAKAITCIGNLKQCGLFFESYISDSDDFIPPPNSPKGNGFGTDGAEWYPNQSYPAMLLMHDLPEKAAELLDTGREEFEKARLVKVFNCPEKPFSEEKSSYYGKASRQVYGMNPYLSGGWATRKLVKRTRISSLSDTSYVPPKQPSSTILVSDSIHSGTSSTAAYVGKIMSSYISSGDGNIALLHGVSANVLALDGSVRAMGVSELVSRSKAASVYNSDGVKVH